MPLQAVPSPPVGQGQPPPLERPLGWLVRAPEAVGRSVRSEPFPGTSRAPAALGVTQPSQEGHWLPHQPVGPGSEEGMNVERGESHCTWGSRLPPCTTGANTATLGRGAPHSAEPEPTAAHGHMHAFLATQTVLECKSQRPVCSFGSAAAEERVRESLQEGVRESLDFQREGWLPGSAPHPCCLHGAGPACKLSWPQ